MKQIILLLFVLLLISCTERTDLHQPVKHLVLNADKTFQTIDGFGVNKTPAQWRNNNMKPALDLLVDDLGCTLHTVP